MNTALAAFGVISFATALVGAVDQILSDLLTFPKKKRIVNAREEKTERHRFVYLVKAN